MIDEKKLIDNLKQSGMIADNDYGNEMVDMINLQPKIGEWIPCRERMPEIEQDVLLSFRSLDVRVGYRLNNEGLFYVYGEEYVSFENTLGWKTLPEAYHE